MGADLKGSWSGGSRVSCQDPARDPLPDPMGPLGPRRGERISGQTPAGRPPPTALLRCILGDWFRRRDDAPALPDREPAARHKPLRLL